ncbi:hypothetical protein BC826DRAFT_141876 [Russula brevipes]|nr:hypothetical protein BC826DRAFT_141876 [Russula brevipes]
MRRPNQNHRQQGDWIYPKQKLNSARTSAYISDERHQACRSRPPLPRRLIWSRLKSFSVCMKPRYHFFQFLAAISRDSPSSHFDGYATLCSPFVEPVVSFLSTTPNGQPVDYDKTKFADAENTCYYRPSKDCAFVDHEGLKRTETK